MNEKFLFDFSKSNVISKKFRTYIRQQNERHEIYRRIQISIIFSIVIKKKFFYIKIMKNKSNFFSKNSYAKWNQYVWKIKNQFDMNQMNDTLKKHFVTTNKIKFFVVIFLKKILTHNYYELLKFATIKIQHIFERNTWTFLKKTSKKFSSKKRTISKNIVITNNELINQYEIIMFIELFCVQIFIQTWNFRQQSNYKISFWISF